MTSFSYFAGVTNDTLSLESNETGFIGRDATVSSLIIGNGQNIDLRVHGTVASQQAISLAGNQITLMVGRTGIVEGLSSSFTGFAAIDFIAELDGPGGVGRLFNEGQIRGNVMGIFFLAGAQDTAYLTNSGTILGEIGGIFTTGEGTTVISNSGLIEGFEIGLSNEVDDFLAFGTILNLTNTGTIRGANTSVGSGTAADTVVNRGLLDGDVSLGGAADLLDNRDGRIEGDVALGADADVFDNRGGTVIGTINGNDGADTFRPGAGIEVIDGGADFDAIDFRGTPAVVVALDESIPNTGHAAGDEYTGVEGIFGSYFADLLIGSSGANTLRGFGGTDILQGGAGSDKIVGGNGIDTATGGAGSDAFVFDKLSEIGDVITDFGSSAGNNDVFNIRASAFGGGLVAGGAIAASQFQSRADNAAQDADDRFIFRTTDRTLWFDADGNGGGAAVMVADLQAGATVDRTDIILI